ncbi:MAG TPA: hydroxymyristoyl-ACP dehydratase [Rhodospirillaceae bacterium]|nr:hydroxymyristoyl-ACP dehydratase [Rhodospirillaceae bacterium]
MKLPSVEVKEQKADKVVLGLTLACTSEAFEGHFPDKPILPGVVQVDWAMRFGSLYMDMGETYAQDLQIKFKKVISPDDILLLTVQIDREKDKLTFTYCIGDRIMSSGKIKLGRT